jgi:hypothetical protein
LFAGKTAATAAHAAAPLRAEHLLEEIAEAGALKFKFHTAAASSATAKRLAAAETAVAKARSSAAN